MVNNWASSTYGLQLISRPQSTALPITPEGCPLPPYIQKLCSTKIRAQLSMVLPLLVCDRRKVTQNLLFFQSRGLVKVGKRGQESRRLPRFNTCPHGMVWYLVHCKTWGALRPGPPPWLIPLHYTIILWCLHLNSGSISHSLFTGVKPLRQICLQGICQILSYRNQVLSRF